jgi:carboxymethylenebutenolidase
MGERFKLKASDGFELNAYRARPDGKPRGGVVVIQEVWGLNNWIRSVVDRWARHGFLAVAPAMFDRVEYGYESDNYGQDQFVIIGGLMKKFDQDKALLDVESAVKAADEGGKVGITAGSGYYGGGVPGYIDLMPKIPLEMHYGSKDKGIPLEQVEDLKKRHPKVDIYVYDGDHGFCNSDRPDHFDEPSCTKASARSLAFFHKHLG